MAGHRGNDPLTDGLEPSVIPFHQWPVHLGTPVSRILWEAEASRRSFIYDNDCSLPAASNPGTRRAASSSPMRTCSGWSLAGRHVAMPPVSSYLAISPLPVPEGHRRYLSVPLVVRLLCPGVTRHPALRSPDFPRDPIGPFMTPKGS